jgi:hypothetical protein
MKRRNSAAIALAVGITLAVSPAFAAQAASGTITNGSFEADAAGTTEITGWTSMNSVIDLGTTVIAGCTSVDTSNYRALRGYAVETSSWDFTYSSVDALSDSFYVYDENDTPVAVLGDPLVYDDDIDVFLLEITVASVVTYLAEADWSSDQTAAFETAVNASGTDPAVNADDPINADLGDLAFSTRVVTDGFDGPVNNGGEEEEDPISFGREGQALELYSDISGENDGYVVHGPAIYSAPFTVGAGRQISLDWKAVDNSDDFHVFGYLLNTDTCTQTEVIDATGLSQDWTTSAVEIPTAGTYRFVFVSGTYDQSWGGAAGAFMYIDNIVQSAIFSTPGVDLSLAASVGDYLPGSEVQVSGGGLEPLSDYDLVLRSTPVTVTTGVTDAEGAFLEFVQLPADIEPGAHTITVTGQGVDGPITLVAYITVGADGTLLYYSTSGAEGASAPAALAATGTGDSAMTVFFALMLTLAGAAALELGRRRRTRVTSAA